MVPFWAKTKPVINWKAMISKRISRGLIGNSCFLVDIQRIVNEEESLIRKGRVLARPSLPLLLVN
jgi:hypothetical protein